MPACANRHWPPARNCLPYTSTSVPPARGPNDGEIEVAVGMGAYVKVAGSQLGVVDTWSNRPLNDSVRGTGPAPMLSALGAGQITSVEVTTEPATTGNDGPNEHSTGSEG